MLLVVVEGPDLDRGERLKYPGLPRCYDGLLLLRFLAGLQSEGRENIRQNGRAVHAHWNVQRRGHESHYARCELFV